MGLSFRNSCLIEVFRLGIRPARLGGCCIPWVGTALRGGEILTRDPTRTFSARDHMVLRAILQSGMQRLIFAFNPKKLRLGNRLRFESEIVA
jgi:hypothetical protein